MSGDLRRLLEAVGLQRRARDVGPTLADIIREDWKEQAVRETLDTDVARALAQRIPSRSSSTSLCDPETGKPFVLSDAERRFLQARLHTQRATAGSPIPSLCLAQSRSRARPRSPPSSC